MKLFGRGSAGAVAAGSSTSSRVDNPNAQQRDKKPAKDIPRFQPLARLVDSDRFQIAIAAVIVANALVIALDTYQSIDEQYGTILVIANDVMYGIFLVELILRILSYGTRPWNFFRSGWNVFDFIVIGGVLIPAVRTQVTILRLLRLARIVRLMRFLPDARVLLLTVTRATPAVLSMVVLTVLIIFLYAVIGWSLFGAELPEQWGDVGTAMLTLFVLLTLENFPNYLYEAQAVNPVAPIYFLSFVLIAAFIVVNLLIGIIISSMDQAREEEAIRLRKSGVDHLAFLAARVQEMHDVLNEIQGELEAVGEELRWAPPAPNSQDSTSTEKSRPN